MSLAIDKRSGLDRRSGNDRRKNNDQEILENAANQRSGRDRRAEQEEIREGWVRVSRHSSADIGLPANKLQ